MTNPHACPTGGDGFLGTFDATGRAVRCAADILSGAKDIRLERRAGVHTGEVEVQGDNIAGLAVTIARRVCYLAGPGEVLVSETARGLHGGRGRRVQRPRRARVESVPGTWRLFSVEG